MAQMIIKVYQGKKIETTINRELEILKMFAEQLGEKIIWL